MTRTDTIKTRTAFIISRKGAARYVAGYMAEGLYGSAYRMEYSDKREYATIFKAAPAKLRSGHQAEPVSVAKRWFVYCDNVTGKTKLVGRWTMGQGNTKTDAVAEYTADLQAKIASAAALLA